MQNNAKVISNLYHGAVSLQKASTSWQTFLDERLRARAQEIALIVAERMDNPEFVRTTAEQAIKKSPFPGSWSSQSLGSGDVGLALMYEYVDACFPGQIWAALAQRYLNLVASSSQQGGVSFPAMFGGTGGLTLTLFQASRGGKRYKKTLERLHQGLCEQILQQTWRRSEVEGGVADRDYDVISGAAGVLAYLVSIEQPNEMVLTTIEHLLAYLTWLAEPNQPMGKERWYIPPSLLPNDIHREAFPQGNFNCGLAHGIPGPLAALALTWLAGYRYPSLCESIGYLANWVVEHQVDGQWGKDWTHSIGLEAASSLQDWQDLPATRSAWCYGAPGVSRSLWLASQALDDEHMRRVAVEAIEATLRRPIVERAIPSPNICHGVAGLLQICLRFANECESILIREHIPLLAEQILSAFNPDFTLGFRDLDQGVPLDKPDWLTGTSGIAMVLLAASTPVAPTWDRALVIA